MAINNEDFSSDQIANKFLVSKENGMTYWDEIEDRAVTNIGGVTGPITLGSGLSITEDGELSAQGGSGGSYTAGHGIKIESDAISTDTAVVADIDYVDGEIASTKATLEARIAEDEEYSAGLNQRLTTAENDIDSLAESKQDVLTAGENITIVDNVISATGGGGGTTYEAGNGITIEDNTISVNSNEVPVFNENLENVGTLQVSNVNTEEDGEVTHFEVSNYELGGDRTDFNLAHAVVMGDPESGDAPVIQGETEFNQDNRMISNSGAVNITLPGHSGPVTVAEGEVVMEFPDATDIETPDNIAPSLDLVVRADREAVYNTGEPVDEWVNLGYSTGTSFFNGKIDTSTVITRGIPNNEQEKEVYDYYERTPEENDLAGELQNIKFYDKGISYSESSNGQSENINYEERINYSGRNISFRNQNNSTTEVFIGNEDLGESGTMNFSVALDQSTETDDNNITIAGGILAMNEGETPKPRVAIAVTNDSPDGTAMNAVDITADDVTIMNMGTSDNSVATKKYVDDHSGGGSTDNKSLKLVSSKNVSLSDFITFEQWDFLDPSVVYFNNKHWLFAPNSYIGNNHAIFSEDGGRTWKTANITGNYPRSGGHTVKVLNNQLVMISPYDSSLYVSNDGIAWESKNVPTPESGTAPAWVDIEYVGNKYVMIGRDRVSSSDPTDPFGLMAVSEDLSNWYQITLPGKDDWWEQPATWLSLATCQFNGTSYLVATSADNDRNDNIWFVDSPSIAPDMPTEYWQSASVYIKDGIAYNVNGKIIIIGNYIEGGKNRIIMSGEDSLGYGWLDLDFNTSTFGYTNSHYAHPYYINNKYYVASNYLISTDGEIDPSGSGQTVKCEEVGYINLDYVADMAIGQNGIVAIQYDTQVSDLTVAKSDMISSSDNGVLWGGQGGVFQGDVDVTQMLREILNGGE